MCEGITIFLLILMPYGQKERKKFCRTPIFIFFLFFQKKTLYLSDYFFTGCNMIYNEDIFI